MERTLRLPAERLMEKIVSGAVLGTVVAVSVTATAAEKTVKFFSRRDVQDTANRVLEAVSRFMSLHQMKEPDPKHDPLPWDD